MLAIEPSRGFELPAHFVRELSATLARQSHEEPLLGNMMVHELVSLLQESFLSLVEQGALEPPRPQNTQQEGEATDAGQQEGAKQPRKGAQIRRQRMYMPSPEDVRRETERLQSHRQATAASQGHAAMRSTRQSLPAFKQRAEVLAAASASRVLVLSGMTGCGKSTQVPQYLLEDWIDRGQGGSCNILVTQPRRLPAISLAQRVAQEFGEEGPGRTVGYAVRLDSKVSKHHTRLLFCTVGVALKRVLEGDPSLEGVSHVVVDEVHERSIDCDLLLLLLRRILEVNRSLRVVLMSATAEAGTFRQYFDPVLQRLGESPCSTVEIPGFTYPVRELYLEDALARTGFFVSRASKWAKAKGGRGPTATPAEQPEDGSGEHEEEAAPAVDSEGRPLPERAAMSLVNIDEGRVNYDLIEELVAYIIRTERAQGEDALLRGFAPADRYRDRITGMKSGSAILVFLPGVEEINRATRALQESAKLREACGGDLDGKGSGVRIYPLHGSLPPSKQARVFDPAPKGVRKVVLSTNVAETSITLDDVVCVIDSGRVKEVQFEPSRNMSALKEQWIARAQGMQRRGRAGRVRPGVCFRLFSTATWQQMEAQQSPEITRSPLEALVLRVKESLPRDAAAATLGAMMTPPPPGALQAALGSLHRIGALQVLEADAEGRIQDERLTPLGRHLVRIPLDPVLGKMLIYGALLRCLDPVLTIAAALSYGRSIFFEPPDRREEVSLLKRKLGQASRSDHIAMVAAYAGWMQARRKGGKSAGGGYCSEMFLSEQALEHIRVSRADFASTLADLGFVPRAYAARVEDEAAPDLGPGSPDEFSESGRIIKACICAGAYPNLVRVQHPSQKYQEVLGGTAAKEARPQELRFFTKEQGRVFLHPSSVNFHSGLFESGWLVFTELFQTSKAFVRESSMVPVFALLLFGGDIEVDHEKQLLRLDRWAEFKAPARIAVLVRELRAEVERLLVAKVEDPTFDLVRAKAIAAMHKLLSTDGF